MKFSKLDLSPVNTTAIITVLINIGFILWIAIASQNSLPPQVPLFYGLPSGEEQLAQSNLLMIPPAFAILLIIANFLLIKTTKNKFLQNVLVSTMVIITALSCITIIKIIFLVG